MRSLRPLLVFAILLATGVCSRTGRACGTAPPSCGPLVSESGTTLPANAKAIRVRTASAQYRIAPSDFSLRIADNGATSSEVEITVLEPSNGVYEIVPISGFKATSSYVLTASSPCDGVDAPDTLHFETGVGQALPDVSTAHLHSSILSETFAHFDAIACIDRPERSRSAQVTGPEVDPPWADVLLYRWVVNDQEWIEVPHEHQVGFSQSCQSPLGSGVWSDGQGLRFWDDDLVVTLELRLPGTTQPIWSDSVTLDLQCTTMDGGAQYVSDAGTQLTSDSDVAPVASDDALNESRESAGCSLALGPQRSTIGAPFLLGFLALLLRRRNRGEG